MSAQFWRPSANGSGLLRSSIWNTVLRLAGIGASLLLGILLARILGPSDFGVYGVLISVALILSVAGRIGFPNLATREIAIAIDCQDWTLAKGVVHWFGRAVVLLSLLTGAMFFLGMLLWNPDDQFGATGNAFWTAVLIPLLALGTLVGAELRGLNHLVAGQSLDSFVRPALTCTLCIAALIYFDGMTTELALIVSAAASLGTLGLGLVWLALWMPQQLKRAPAARHRRRWGKSGLMLGAVDGLRQLDANLGLIILGALSQAAQAGYLRVAISAIVLTTLPQTVVHLVTAPTLARLNAAGEREKLQEILSRSSVNLFLVTLAFLLVLAVAGLPLIRLIFGDEYGPAWLPLLLLTAGQLINAAFGLGWVLMTMAGGERRLGQFYGISTAMSLAAGIPLCIAFGAIGAALASVLSITVQNWLIWHHIRVRHSVDCSVIAALRERPLSLG